MRAVGVWLMAVVAWGAASFSLPGRVLALEVVLHDVASDRVERQRAYSRGHVPLAGSPDLSKLTERLSERGLAKGRAIYIRVFKEESELELWMQNGGGSFTLLATYPICHWTGTLGPKLREGDKQSPEGFYSVGAPQTRLVGRWRRAFNLGFPNLHDQLLSRTGSYILIHGGCSSVGCFAMTDQVQEEIYALAHAALEEGQGRFQVHVFPFRMTEENLARRADHEWAHTWADLKPAYDSFERTRVPPRVVLCGVRYKVADGLPGETGGTEARLPVLRPTANSAGIDDPTAVVDISGTWSPPSCVLEDEDRRKAAYTMTRATALGLPSAAHSESEVQEEPAPAAAIVKEPVLEARQRKPAKSAKSAQRGETNSGGLQSQAPGISEGFGNALPASKGQVSATGG